jgi:hypothetical protein
MARLRLGVTNDPQSMSASSLLAPPGADIVTLRRCVFFVPGTSSCRGHLVRERRFIPTPNFLVLKCSRQARERQPKRD